jgi:glycosyltransferase involved in cell wall biosynthesis
MARRRILLLVTDLEIGGTPTVVRELARRLHGDAAHVEVVSLKGLGHNGALLVDAGVAVTAMNAEGITALPATALRVRRLIAGEDFDTVLSFLVHANVVAALSTPRHVWLVQSIQTTQPEPRWHWTAQAWAARRAQRVVVPSASVVDAGCERSGISREKFVVIPNAIEPGDFVRSPFPVTSPQVYPVGFIGRLDPVKRVPDLVRAVVPIGERVSLDIFGDGPERERIRREMEDVGCIALRGAVRRPQEALEQLGLLVLPSEAEGFGLVLIEAMAAGVPVIGTDVPGIREVIQDGVNGLLVPVADPPALRAAIERVIGDKDLRHRLIEGGLRSVRERYTWDVVLPQYRELLGVDQS